MKKQNTGKQSAGIWNRFAAVPFCFSVSAALLAICSRSSPFYPLNNWSDANCFFTVGKSMMNGMVLYRDIYEQKGPLLYFLHGIAYLISNASFLGVYLLEVLALAMFLLSMFRILWLFVSHVPLPVPVALGSVIVVSASFAVGDSVEELCLPLLSWSLYHMLKSFQGTQNGGYVPLSFSTVVLNGFFAGCVLWMKFTLLGFYIGWFFVIFLLELLKKGILPALKTGFSFLLGMLVSTLPWIIYFGVNGALYDLWEVYFYNNIFLYSIPSESLTERITHSVYHLLSGLRDNLWYAVPIAAGMLWVFFCPGRRMPARTKAGIFSTFLFLAAGVYIGGRAYAYYVLILGVYAVFGIVPILMLAGKAGRDRKHPPGRLLRTLFTVLGIVLCGVYAVSHSANIYFFGADRSVMVQYNFSDVMHELDDDPTLLNYGFMDLGFYTAADIVPTCKYFCALNIPLNDIKEGQDACLISGGVDFVVTCASELDLAQFHQYELIYKEVFYSKSYSAEFFLYRLVDDSSLTFNGIVGTLM